MPTRRTGSLRVVITATVAAALALSLVIVPAWGDTIQAQSPVQATVMIQAPGNLVAKGVAVDIDIEYQCLPGVQLEGMFVGARERFGRNIAEGFGFVDSSELGPCIGFVPQIATVRLDAFGTPFKPGTALVETELFGFDQFGFFSVTDEREVKLKPNNKK